MFDKSTTIIVVMLFCFYAQSAFAQPKSQKGTCAVVAGSMSSQKFATLKCAPKSNPRNYVIRSTVWERDGKKAYRDLAKFSGRRFTCDLVRGRQTISDDVVSTHYSIRNCK